MKSFGFTAIIASALATAIVGLAAPATADVSHQSWLDQIGPHVTVPHVDTTVHQSR